MANSDSINHARLKELLSYDPESGLLIWIGDRGGRQFTGKQAGYLRPDGYIEITVDGWRYFAHRLAWFYSYAQWPTHVIDHINGDKTDNRISNLRDVLPTTNSQNTPQASKNNATGVRGISAHRDKYRAAIRVSNKRYDLGIFDTLEEASNAYVTAKETLTGAALLRP